ncbi:MAG: hypothetical protein JWM86_2412 [Thermoleophilia bacterium]|nr:hypothetical protein [Thermoleophilia bacterium]
MNEPVRGTIRRMFNPATTALAASPDAPDRRGSWRGVVGLSLAVTAAAALFALVAALAVDARWSYVFVMTRWIVVFVLLALPLAHQVAMRRGARLPLPWALRTPATALVLTIEGIAYDIISANVG